MKKIKKWNGRGFGKYDHFFIGAHNQKHAAELLSKVVGHRGALAEIRNYHAPCWGLSMNGIDLEIGVWATLKENPYEKPRRVI